MNLSLKYPENVQNLNVSSSGLIRLNVSLIMKWATHKHIT